MSVDQLVLIACGLSFGAACVAVIAAFQRTPLDLGRRVLETDRANTELAKQGKELSGQLAEIDKRLAMAEANVAASVKHAAAIQAHTSYDLASRIATDAAAHADESSRLNTAQHGGKAKMDFNDKMVCALDYAELHWPEALGKYEKTAMRRMVLAVLGKSRKGGA